MRKPTASDRLVVVEASAGTGKTYFLEHRFVDLLLGTSATVDQILVVTFTEKATAELRTRIRGLLARQAGSHAKLREALIAFDRAAIHTIHGFCQRLLVEDAFSGRRLFDQVQVPDDAAFAEAFHATLREQIAVEPALCRVLDAYLAGGGTVAKLGATLLACARRGAELEPAFDPVRLAAACARFQRPAHGYDAALGIGPKGNTKTAMVKRLEQIEAAIGAITGDDDEARAIDAARRFDGEWFDFLASKRDQVTRPGTGGAELMEAVAALDAALVPIAAIAAARFLPRVLERVRASKARRGQFDFQDMLRLVADTLAGERGDELAARLRKRHPWAMIDEFQDTDEQQWSIFRRVWADHPHTGLTIVGDPKQAIYSFRGADVHTYVKAREALRAQGALVTALEDNYRSSKQLIAAVNALIDGTHGTYWTGDIRYDHPVRAATSSAAEDARLDSDGAPVRVFEVENVDTLAEKIADEALALVSGGGFAPKDLHVLTRSGAQSDQVAAALRARGVPCALYQREHLFDAREALEVADLLAAIADPRDRAARLRAWTTSFFAVPLARLGELIELPDGHALLALLHDWRGVALRKDWDALFHRIVDDTRWIERALVAGGGERAVTNVLHLFELLHDDLARSPCELGELVARLRGWIEHGKIDRPDDVDIQRLETDRAAVQVMTIHRSKGLEAPVVFVCGGPYAAGEREDAHLFHDDRANRRTYVGELRGRYKAWAEKDTIEENQRLMYVAMTRAKVRLYLPFFDKKPAPRSAIAPINERVRCALAARATDDESARLFTCEKVETGSVTAPAPVEAVDDLAGWEPPVLAEVAPDPTWAEIRDARGSIVVTSYSKIRSSATRSLAGGDREVRGEDHSAPAPLEPDDLPAGAASGLYLHEVLEHVPLASARADADWQAWAARRDVAPVLARAARKHGITEAHRLRGARIVHGALLQPIVLAGETLGALADAPRVAREVEFTYPLGNAYARGYVDLLVAWDERLWVVDYKSDAIGANNAEEARPHVERHYSEQWKLYAIAAARLLGLSGEADSQRRFGGVLYWFLRTGYVVDVRVRWPELAVWESELRGRV